MLFLKPFRVICPCTAVLTVQTNVAVYHSSDYLQYSILEYRDIPPALLTILTHSRRSVMRSNRGSCLPVRSGGSLSRVARQ